MNTPIIANLIPRLREHAASHLRTYLEKGGELSPILESIEFWWDGIRDRDFPDLPMWSDLPAPDRDALFDAWIEAAEEFFALRCYLGAGGTGKPVGPSNASGACAPSAGTDVSAVEKEPTDLFGWFRRIDAKLTELAADQSLPVSVAPAASLSPEAAYAFLKEENAVLRSQIENHDATLEQVKACHRSQVNLLREKLKDCEKALERAESAPAASCASPAPLVPEVVKRAVGALSSYQKALAALFMGPYTCDESVAEGLLRAQANGDAALTALRNYSPAPSPSVELLREMLNGLREISSDAGDSRGRSGEYLSDAIQSLISKLNAALA